MMASGPMAKLKATVGLIMLTVMFMRVLGLMTRLRGKARITTVMGQSMWGSGLRTSRMGKELRRGQTVQSTMANTGKVASMAQESLIGLMAQNMTARSMRTTYMAMAITHGQTTVNTRDSGCEIRCMETDGS